MAKYWMTEMNGRAYNKNKISKFTLQLNLFQVHKSMFYNNIIIDKYWNVQSHINSVLNYIQYCCTHYISNIK